MDKFGGTDFLSVKIALNLLLFALCLRLMISKILLVKEKAGWTFSMYNNGCQSFMIMLCLCGLGRIFCCNFEVTSSDVAL